MSSLAITKLSKINCQLIPFTVIINWDSLGVKPISCLSFKISGPEDVGLGPGLALDPAIAPGPKIAPGPATADRGLRRRRGPAPGRGRGPARRTGPDLAPELRRRRLTRRTGLGHDPDPGKTLKQTDRFIDGVIGRRNGDCWIFLSSTIETT